MCATYFFNPKLQAQHRAPDAGLRRSNQTTIGNHTFWAMDPMAREAALRRPAPHRLRLLRVIPAPPAAYQVASNLFR